MYKDHSSLPGVHSGLEDGLLAFRKVMTQVGRQAMLVYIKRGSGGKKTVIMCVLRASSQKAGPEMGICVPEAYWGCFGINVHGGGSEESR